MKTNQPLENGSNYIYCPRCGNSAENGVIFDRVHGEIICKSCGNVLQEKLAIEEMRPMANNREKLASVLPRTSVKTDIEADIEPPTIDFPIAEGCSI